MPEVETKIWMAIKARVSTLPGWAANRIAWPMDPFEPGQLPYVEVAHLPNRVNRPFIGSNDPQERPGILQLTLCWPVAQVGTGLGKVHPDVLVQRAGEIAAHWPTDLPLDFGGVRVRVEHAPDVAQPMRDDAYWRVPVSIRYKVFS